MVRFLRRWGIRSRLLLVAAIPVTMVTLVLGGFSTWSRLQDNQRFLFELGRSQVAHLAAMAGFPLYSGDLPTLERELQQVVSLTGVQMAAVLDADLRLLALAGEKPRPLRLPRGAVSGEPLQSGSPLLIFSLPVRAEVLEAEPEPLSPETGHPAQGEVLGWVYLGLDRHSLAARERAILLTSLGVAAVVLSLSILLALGISSSVSVPVRRLTDTLLRLRRGELDVVVPEDSGGELGTLEAGFNRLAATVAESQRALQGQADQATADLQQALDILERRNRELQQAHRQALAADRAKSEFLARMSHEIRTPINAVVGFTDLMQKSNDPEERAEFADTAQRAAGSLLAVIDGILAFSKLESGQVELEQVPFDLGQTLEDVVAIFAPAAQDKGLELVLLMEADLPARLRGDPKALTEILMNLLSNAVKFTSEGEILVRAGQGPGGDGVEISVADSGIGISADAKQRLFNPFVQADTSIRRRFGGTGLGLVICQRLARLLGGEIEIEDQHPRGTRFQVRLPLPAVDAESNESPERPLDGCLTLLYDAHPQSRRALRKQLLFLGAELFQTGDWARFEALLQERRERGPRFRLLVLGLGRRELVEGGLSRLVSRLRAWHSGPLLVLASAAPGYAPPSLVRRRGVLCRSKPIRRRLLRDSLAKLLGGAPVAAEPETEPAKAPPQFPGCRVLVAEDHRFNRALMQSLLAPLGCELALAEDGREALRLAAARRFELILMDLHMPELDGLAAAREIRAGAGLNRRTPIVAVTADLLADKIANAAGIDDLVFKPVSQEQLVRVLERWACASATAQPPAAPRPAQADLQRRLFPELVDLVERLRQCLALGDLEALREEAHQLAGLCGYFELRTLEVAARGLNRLAAEGASPADLRLGLERVSALLGRAVDGAPAPQPEPGNSEKP